MDYSIILSSIITAIATLTSVFIGRKCMQRKPVCPVTKDTSQSANVYTALKYTLEEMGADRAYVLEFHNGGSYYSGRGQQKFSSTYELVEPGVSAESDNSQDYKVSRYSKYLHKLIKDGYYEKSANDIADEGFKSLLRDKGVKYIYNVPITTLNGKVIGILGVDYVKNDFEGCKDCPEDDVHKFMRRQARIVSGYLI